MKPAVMGIKHVGFQYQRKVIVVSDLCDTENDSKKCNNCFLFALPS